MHIQPYLFFGGRCEGHPCFRGFAPTLTAGAEAAAERLFAALADGGTVRMAMEKTFSSPRFGMIADRFGVGWMVMVAD
jgi:PhnB protein